MALFKIDTSGDTNLLSTETCNTAKVTRVDALLTEVKEEKTQAAATIAPIEHTAGDSDAEEDPDFDYFGLPKGQHFMEVLSQLHKEQQRDKEQKRPTKVQRDLQWYTEKFDQLLEKKRNKKPSKGKFQTIDEADLFDMFPPDFVDKTDLANTHLTKEELAKEMKNTQLVPGLEHLKGLPKLNKKQQREENRRKRATTKGAGWFDLPATEKTEEVENELKLLQMRSVLHPKRFYKKNDLKVLPKYFQVGVVQPSPLDFYSERGSSKRKTNVEEILEDAQEQSYIKNKFDQVQKKRMKYSQLMKAQKKKNKNK